jgi:hypothetical protein
VKKLGLFASVASAVAAKNTFIVLVKAGGKRESAKKAETKIDE